MPLIQRFHPNLEENVEEEYVEYEENEQVENNTTEIEIYSENNTEGNNGTAQYLEGTSKKNFRDSRKFSPDLLLHGKMSHCWKILQCLT